MLHCSRRTFLQAASVAASSAVALGADSFSHSGPEQRQFIFVWLRGGLSPLESFDPKPDAAATIRGETASIETSIPGVRFAEFFPRLAQRARKLCVVRGLIPANDRHGLAEASLLSGVSADSAERLPQPAYGAWLANRFGPRDGMWPNFQIGRELDLRYGGGSVGNLPLFTGPLIVPSRHVTQTGVMRDFCFPGGVSFRRLVELCGPRPSFRRFESAWRLVSDRLQQLDGDANAESNRVVERLVAAAHRWHVSAATREVLETHHEPAHVRALYGDSTLGDDCLQARRLIAAGARCVTITSGGWDHHAAITHEMRVRGPQLDTGLSALLDDLEQRGLLATTTVICLSDFGRTPHLNTAGGRDHWSHTGICLLAGAGVPRRQVIGRTDATGASVCDSPVTPEQLRTFIINDCAV